MWMVRLDGEGCAGACQRDAEVEIVIGPHFVTDRSASIIGFVFEDVSVQVVLHPVFQEGDVRPDTASL